jgi:hypothetical protein
MNKQVSILLNPPNIDWSLREGIRCLSKFVSSTLEWICSLDASSHGFDLKHLCVVMSSLPATAHRYVWLLASSPDDACFHLFVSVVEHWICSMAKRFLRTAARLSL